jgi:hypothetical protein
MVNNALRAWGRDESLREGDGYFYFGGGEAVHWLSSSVMVRRISDLTLDQWMGEFEKLLKANQKLDRQMKKIPPGKKKRQAIFFGLRKPPAGTPGWHKSQRYREPRGCGSWGSCSGTVGSLAEARPALTQATRVTNEPAKAESAAAVRSCF